MKKILGLLGLSVYLFISLQSCEKTEFTDLQVSNDTIVVDTIYRIDSNKIKDSIYNDLKIRHYNDSIYKVSVYNDSIMRIYNDSISKNQAYIDSLIASNTDTLTVNYSNTDPSDPAYIAYIDSLINSDTSNYKSDTSNWTLIDWIDYEKAHPYRLRNQYK